MAAPAGGALAGRAARAAAAPGLRDAKFSALALLGTRDAPAWHGDLAMLQLTLEEFQLLFSGCPLSTAGLPIFALLFCKWKVVPEGVRGKCSGECPRWF